MNNNLTLYHSTTDFYLDSIKQYGLGGVNPNKAKGILFFLQELYKLSEKYLINKKEYQEVRFTTDGMARQCLKGVFNFKHDKVYLSMMESTAIRYSLNKYGSELLSRSILLYDLLCIEGYKHEVDTSLLDFDIEKLKNATSRKILLKVHNIDFDYIETETGESAIEKISEMQEIEKSDKFLFEALSQQFNFGLKETIDFKNIEVFEIVNPEWKLGKMNYYLINYVG